MLCRIKLYDCEAKRLSAPRIICLLGSDSSEGTLGQVQAAVVRVDQARPWS